MTEVIDLCSPEPEVDDGYILSIDIGIKHFAYCVSKDSGPNIQILELELTRVSTQTGDLNLRELSREINSFALNIKLKYPKTITVLVERQARGNFGNPHAVAPFQCSMVEAMIYSCFHGYAVVEIHPSSISRMLKGTAGSFKKDKMLSFVAAAYSAGSLVMSDDQWAYYEAFAKKDDLADAMGHVLYYKYHKIT